jgi:antitoxin component of MazEF toxin-antitoxin module
LTSPPLFKATSVWRWFSERSLSFTLPEDVVKAIDAKIGDEVAVYVEGKKIIIEKD